MSGKVVHFPANTRQAKFRKTLLQCLRMRDRAQRESAKVSELPDYVKNVIANAHGRLDLFVVKIAGRRHRCFECGTLMSMGDFYFALDDIRTCVPCAEKDTSQFGPLTPEHHA